MRLFHAPTSPFARKVRVLIAEKGIGGIELVAVSPFDAPAELAGSNPLSKVPALILGDGLALYDSPVICEYLDWVSGDPLMIPRDGDQRWQVLRRQALANGIMDSCLSLALEINRRPDNERSPSWIEHWCRTMRRSTDALEAEIGSYAASVDIGHVATACALAYLDLRAAKHLDWRAGRPALADWFAAFSQRPSMLATQVPD